MLLWYAMGCKPSSYYCSKKAPVTSLYALVSITNDFSKSIQCRQVAQYLTQLHKCYILQSTPGPWSLRTSQVHQQSSDIGIILDVLCIVISKAWELLKLFYRGQFWPHTYSLNFVGVRTQATSFNNMPQVLNQCLTKETFLKLCKKPFNTQFIKHFP